jgi:hypothetical protein
MSPDPLAHTDCTLPGELLQAVGEIACKAQCGVIRMPFATDRTDDRGAIMEPHTQRQGNSLRAQQVFGKGGKRSLDPQHGVQRAQRMIFVGDGSAEDRPGRVPSDEADSALDALDLDAHQVEELTEHGGQHLQIEHLCQDRDALDAHREDCCLLAFAPGRRWLVRC